MIFTHASQQAVVFEIRATVYSEAKSLEHKTILCSYSHLGSCIPKEHSLSVCLCFPACFLKINKIYNLNAKINKKRSQESIPTLHYSPEQRLQRAGQSNSHNIIEIGACSTR